MRSRRLPLNNSPDNERTAAAAHSIGRVFGGSKYLDMNIAAAKENAAVASLRILSPLKNRFVRDPAGYALTLIFAQAAGAVNTRMGQRFGGESLKLTVGEFWELIDTRFSSGLCFLGADAIMERSESRDRACSVMTERANISAFML